MQARWLPVNRTDIILALAVVAVTAISIGANVGTQGRSSNALAYVFALSFGGLMLLRRSFPIAVLVVTALGLCAYYTLNFTPIGLAVPLAAALYSAAEAGHLRMAVMVAAVLVSAAWFFRFLGGESLAFLFGYELPSTTGLIAASLALGEGTRIRRLLRSAQLEREGRLQREHEQSAQTTLNAERLRLARELHDSLGHSLSVISINASLSLETLRDEPGNAEQHLQHVQGAVRASLQELRSTVHLLREGSAPLQPQIGHLLNLSSLVSVAEQQGLRVRITQQGSLGQVPTSVGHAAYRVVQEALTNVSKHAQARAVTIALRAEQNCLRIQIEDDGCGRVANLNLGHGLMGMRERVQALGGRWTLSDSSSGGLRITVELPFGDEA